MKNKNKIVESVAKKVFDNEKYLKLQSEKLMERVQMFDNKLYMEFGGKILDDLNVARVLPGYRSGIKMELLAKMKDKAEMIFCIRAEDIEKKKVRADYGITYDVELLRLVEKFEKLDIGVAGVVVTQYAGQMGAMTFKNQLERRGIRVYLHTKTKGYPTDVDVIVSDEGYGVQPYVETTKPLVVVAAPGPNSGKLATCLAQLYHEYKRGVRAGYAKFETLPVWNLPLKHPVNIEYEASTADLGDKNMIDNFHLEKYGEVAVNYNRDLEVFPVVKNILKKIMGEDLYYSPTDMGVNMIGKCILDDEAVKKASCDEIVRRYLNSLCDYKNGLWELETVERIKALMDEAGVNVKDRKVVGVALATKEKKGSDIVAIELKNGKIITGKNTEIMTASAAAAINAMKELGGIEDSIHLISPVSLKPMLRLKREIYGEDRLNVADVLVALSASEAVSPTVEVALARLGGLRRLEAHSTVMLGKVEVDTLKALGMNLTCTDVFV